MIDFTIFYKERKTPSEIGSLGHWDLFLSAYRTSERVREVFAAVSATRKVWLLLPEYGYGDTEHPEGELFEHSPTDEASYYHALLQKLDIQAPASIRLCVDITGFIGHYVVFLVRWLQYLGVRHFDALYAEPTRYRDRENTRFSDEAVIDVRQILGFEGSHRTDTSHDLLVIGSGYDHRLISEVANSKDYAQKVQLFGLPSLHPDMFQESILRVRKAGAALGPADDPTTYRYAPANDPFATAQVVKDIVDAHRRNYPESNIYLSPLATKPQALGFALYYLFEGDGRPTSIFYPFCERYERETTHGTSHVWRYQIEVPARPDPTNPRGQ
ncbi:MAG: hypothetical protein MJE77_13640 [Proteobacteria bacterium]|nr:hypothetical protein [Pseudomonadota bacterium]